MSCYDRSSFEGEDDNKLVTFRYVRDEIKDWIKGTFG